MCTLTVSGTCSWEWSLWMNMNWKVERRKRLWMNNWCLRKTDFDVAAKDDDLNEFECEKTDKFTEKHFQEKLKEIPPKFVPRFSTLKSHLYNLSPLNFSHFYPFFPFTREYTKLINFSLQALYVFVFHSFTNGIEIGIYNSQSWAFIKTCKKRTEFSLHALCRCLFPISTLIFFSVFSSFCRLFSFH